MQRQENYKEGCRNKTIKIAITIRKIFLLGCFCSKNYDDDKWKKKVKRTRFKSSNE